MHSHDRTLLAKLGFQDPDKSEPRHDLACRYLSEDEQVIKLATLSYPAPTVDDSESSPVKPGTGNFDLLVAPKFTSFEEAFKLGLPCHRSTVRSVGTICSSRSLEQPIAKGVGQYKTTIGFLDAVAHFRHVALVDTIGVDLEGTRYSRSETLSVGIGRLLIEVKIGKVEVSAILRQIRLYQEYEDVSRRRPDKTRYSSSDLRRGDFGAEYQQWIVATPFAMSDASTQLLKEHGIVAVRLGPKFDAWCAKQGESVDSDSVEI